MCGLFVCIINVGFSNVPSDDIIVILIEETTSLCKKNRFVVLCVFVFSYLLEFYLCENTARDLYAMRDTALLYRKI